MKKLLLAAIFTVALFLASGSQTANAASPWPGQVDLWTSANITSTIHYRTQDTTGANTLHLFYRFGPASGTGSITMTINGRWRDVVGPSTVVYSAVGASVVSSGVMTVENIYPALTVNLHSSHTTSATVSLVGDQKLTSAISITAASDLNTEAVLVDYAHNSARITPMGEIEVAPTFRLVGVTWTSSTLDTNFWTNTVSGTGAVTVTGAVLTAGTGVAANSSVSITSTRVARYINGAANRFRAVVRIPDSGIANNVRRWGAFSSTDGCFFELNGTTLYAVTRKAGIDTPVASSSWNGTAYTWNNNVATYEMIWTNSKVDFYIGGTLRHTMSASTASWSDSLHLPVKIENINSSGLAVSVNLEIRIASIYRLGQLDTLPTYRNIATATTTVLKVGPGTLHRLVINGSGVAGTVTIYDNTAGLGSKVGTLDLAKVPGPVTLEYMSPFFIGLCAVTTGTVDVTFIYE